ncbi:nucleotidyltransferase family protein [Knoellia sp. p5-6-4]|uniref:nucleotidyltransferase family protein n=1 Tax=unclassified Knoellia TaxID=2618719 RepID=UPI0023D9B93D|nr:nucleotidyltransferase family protein [Knoellia sp. p5-6-4]MDF2144145.1 nucleotidyltransferase family protein [Knoellia sp. p5-6-4]
MAETAELRMSEAVPLAHALVARLAELEDVRLLFVKGPTAVALGARPPRPSTDVDVLCEPGGMERLGAALERCGWRRRVPKSSVHQLEHAAKYLFEHSVHYIHDEWPCDLDIHFNFPGFLAPDDVVFEELWRRRTTVDVAHWPVPSADLLGQAAVVALHSLRDPQFAHTSPDPSFVAESLERQGPEAVEAFAQLAAATGSAETLRPLLERLGVPRVESTVDPELVRRWQVRQQNAGAYTTSWLIELRHRPWREKPRLIWHALLLPSDQLFSTNIGMPRTRRNTARLQLQRWLRAARHLPRGLRAARRAEEQVR